MNMFLTTRCATVALSPARTSRYVWSQTFLPVSASRAMTWAFNVTANTRPSATATPRLTLPQQSAPAAGLACWYRHNSDPVGASMAQIQPSHPETNMIPSTTIGEASNEYVDLP